MADTSHITKMSAVEAQPAAVKRRPNMPRPVPDLGGGSTEIAHDDNHPSGAVVHGGGKQLLRFILFVAYFWTCCCTIVATEFLGVPLYWLKKEWFYKNIAYCKESFGIVITCMTKWWSPTVVRISGDESVSGELRQLKDGRLETAFPKRLVLIANHQLYSDWLYLWWIGYANRPKMSGHFYIILKESIKYIPLLGQGMQLFNFIFMSRKWEKDKPRMAYRLGKLKQRIIGSNKLRPMWLLIFPEGTNLSDNGRANSAKWAAKQGLPDLRHQMIPRSTGLHFCLQELKGTVDYVYDCTMAYEGIPYGGYGEEYFTLRSSYFEGRPPKSVNMFWRRFAIDSIPLDTIEEFDVWLRARWTEKDDLLEEYVTTGRFPPSQDLEFQTEDEKGRLYAGHQGGFIETEMKPQYGFEILRVFGLVGGAGVAASLGVKALRYGKGLVGLA